MDPIAGQVTKGEFSIEVTTTQECNLGCTYCFEGCGDNPDENYKLNKNILDFDVVSEKIDFLLQDEEFNKRNDGIRLDFWGGEPTLNMSLIMQAFEKYLPNPKVNFYLSSNGYDIRGLLSLIQYLKDKDSLDRFQMQVSYDGRIKNPLRLTLTGKDSTEKVRDNILKLLDTGVKLGLKSTITAQMFPYLLDIWEDYNELYYLFKEKKLSLVLAPTIDYYDNNNYSFEKEFEQSMLKIAKKELEFYKQNNRFLWKWFNGSKKECGAGTGISAIDVEGDVLVCHGGFYQDNKEELTLSSIYESNEKYRDSIFEFSDKLKEYNKGYKEPDYCFNCIATECMRCPVKKSEISNKEVLFDKWVDHSNQPGLCKYFKIFGKIDRALQDIIGDLNGL